MEPIAGASLSQPKHAACSSSNQQSARSVGKKTRPSRACPPARLPVTSVPPAKNLSRSLKFFPHLLCRHRSVHLGIRAKLDESAGELGVVRHVAAEVPPDIVERDRAEADRMGRLLTAEP